MGGRCKIIVDLPDWEAALAALWRDFDTLAPEAFRDRIAAHVAVLGPDDPVGLFEKACSYDSTGQSSQAIPLYRRALATGLSGLRRRRAAIQLASSLRAGGSPDECLSILRTEQSAPSDELDDAVTAVTALALADKGMERDALAITLVALAKHLPRYQRSMTVYALGLRESHE